MPGVRPLTKILVDGGDPDETLRVQNLLGFVDGQTTNPTFVAKNADVQRLIASGRTLTCDEQKGDYKKIVQTISPLVGNAGVSIEICGMISLLEHAAQLRSQPETYEIEYRRECEIRSS